MSTCFTVMYCIVQCFPGCLTIQIRTVLCIFIVVLIYSVAQGCVVSVSRGSRVWRGEWSEVWTGVEGDAVSWWRDTQPLHSV